MLEVPDQPTRIGRYEIIRPLGEGAMAQVFLAELQTFGGFRRKVALKIVRPEFARDPKFGQLMSREAMIGSLLQHPNVVETLEFNEADGRMFLALEFVEGETVEDLLKATKAETGTGLPLDLSLEIIVQVLKGLGYAHNLRTGEDEEMGIIHRDLKPGNIMVSRHGVVKVMDFGIAKAKVAAATITAAGQVRGTPIYMAPEQVMGKPLDHRCDQFAAATVLYELITGEQLFIARNLIEIMRRVSRAEVADAIVKMNLFHPGLGDITAKMWKADAAERWADCDAAATVLEDLLPSVKRAMANGEVPDRVDEVPVPEAPVKVANIAVPKEEEPTSRGTRTSRRQPKQKESQGLLGLLGFRKAKEEPKKRRRRKRRPGETGPMSADGSRRRQGESGGMGTTGGGRGSADNETVAATGSIRRRRRKKRRSDAAESQPMDDTRPQREPVATAPPPEPEPPEPPTAEPEPPLADTSDIPGRLEANPLMSSVAGTVDDEEPDADPPAVEPDGESVEIMFMDTTFSHDVVTGELPSNDRMAKASSKVESLPSTNRLEPIDLGGRRGRPVDTREQPPAPAQPAPSQQASSQATPVTWTEQPAGTRDGEEEGDDALPSGDLDAFFTED